MGRLYDLFGAWECIDMVIPLKSTVAMAVPNQRRRRHRVDRFNEMETLIDDQRDKFQLWRINLTGNTRGTNTKQYSELKEHGILSENRSIMFHG